MIRALLIGMLLGILTAVLFLFHTPQPVSWDPQMFSASRGYGMKNFAPRSPRTQE
jgi:hypothetical protein